MYHPTTRVLAVLSLLQSHGRLTGAQLAERLEVNIRTVRTYVTMLQDLGAPIFAERGRSGAYELEAQFKLPPMMFTNDEAVALAIGLLAAHRLAPADSVAAIASARAKLEEVLPADLKARVQALTATISLDVPAVETASASQVMLTMSSAAQSQHRVHMSYRSRQYHDTERDFDPYGLAYHHGEWYVVGRCHLRHDLRSFRLDRITHAALTTTHFDRPKSFDALRHVVESIATLPRKFEFELLLKTDLTTAHKEITGIFGLLEPDTEGIVFHGSTDDLDWLARQIAGFSFDFVIHEPAALCEALRQRADQLLKLAVTGKQ
ncbi:MAG: YafY family transcriptional regulator [Anaerolineae bacterium]|nr:YafY family transcriptional regulator [Anaerolineae bacterium]